MALLSFISLTFRFRQLQVTKQGMEMAAEGALLVSPNLGSCAIDSTFTAQVEHRNVKEVIKLNKWLYTAHFM
jgi:hypothetical protein